MVGNSLNNYALKYCSRTLNVWFEITGYITFIVLETFCQTKKIIFIFFKSSKKPSNLLNVGFVYSIIV